ncbi:MAG: hypothetical protein ABFS05_12690 [Bacteroidota bacterium]
MLPDPLTLKYLLLFILAIWGSLIIVALKHRMLALILGTVIFLTIGYVALGSGFSIRIPYIYEKMEIIVYTTYEDRVYALARPPGSSVQPMHIIFSIDRGSRDGALMRKSFFDAVRAREGKPHKTKIIINMRRYTAEQGVLKYEATPPLPPKP